MAEIDRLGDFGDVALDQLPIAAEAVAGEDQRIAADQIVGLAAPAPDPCDTPAGFGIERGHRRMGENRDVGPLGGRSQPIDQFRAAPARQPVHPERGMAGIIEVLDHLEREGVAIGEPLDRRRGAFADHAYQRGIGFAVRLGQDILGEELWAIRDPLRALEARPCGRDQAGRQRG